MKRGRKKNETKNRNSKLVHENFPLFNVAFLCNVIINKLCKVLFAKWQLNLSIQWMAQCNFNYWKLLYNNKIVVAAVSSITISFWASFCYSCVFLFISATYLCVYFYFIFLFYQDVDSSRSYINDLYSDDDNNKIQDSLIYLKNVVIGSDKQKTIVISQGIVPRLMFLLSQDSTPLPIRYDAAIVLGEYGHRCRVYVYTV